MTSSRCHGPGCRNAAVVEFFCSEACQLRYDRKLFAERGGQPLPNEAVTRSVAGFTVPAGGLQIEAARVASPSPLERLREVSAELEARRQVILCSAADEERVKTASYSLPGNIEVRVSEFAEPGRVYVLSGSAMPFGLPPREPAASAANPQVASKTPQVDSMRGWLSTLFRRMFGRTP